MHLFTTSSGLSLLLISALRATIIAGFAGLGIGIFRLKTTLARLALWRCVLLAALAMPLLGTLLPPMSIPIPTFFETPQSESPDRFRTTPQSTGAVMNSSAVEVPVGASHLGPISTVEPPSPHPRSREVSRWLPAHFETVAAGIYSLVAALLLLRFLLGVNFSRRLVRASRPITEERVRTCLASSASKLRAVPLVAESTSVSVPVTTGILWPAVVLPDGWREWDDATLGVVLAHESSHILRRDSLTQSISLFHCAIFWFSPLAWWLDRRLASLAEEASDEAVLAQGADRSCYARTLLRFLEALSLSPRRVWWQGVSMGNGGHAEQRLEKILTWRGSFNMNLKKSVVVAMLLFSMSILYLVASVRPLSRSQQAQLNTTASSRLPAQPATVPPMPAARAEAGSGKGPAFVPVDLAMTATPVSHLTWSPGQSSDTSERGDSYSYDDDERFIIVSGKSDRYTMAGSMQDIHHVETLKKQIPGAFIWFQRDEKSYIIRDEATVARARSFWAPQEELGRKQEELGKQQEALGKEQEDLAKKMEQVRVSIPDMTAALDNLKAKLQKLGPTATMDQIGEIQSEIGELQSKIGEIQSQAGEQQGKLGEEQGRLGEQQDKLGEQQDELGRQQADLASKAIKQMKELLDEAIKNGTAKPEAEGSGGATL